MKWERLNRSSCTENRVRFEFNLLSNRFSETHAWRRWMLKSNVCSNSCHVKNCFCFLSFVFRMPLLLSTSIYCYCCCLAAIPTFHSLFLSIVIVAVYCWIFGKQRLLDSISTGVAAVHEHQMKMDYVCCIWIGIARVIFRISNKRTIY